MPIQNGYSASEIDRLSLVLLAGPMAEHAKFGSSSNGAILFQQLDTCMLMAADVMSPFKMQAQARWALIKLPPLLRKHQKKIDAVAAGMEREASLHELIALLETTAA